MKTLHLICILLLLIGIIISKFVTHNDILYQMFSFSFGTWSLSIVVTFCGTHFDKFIEQTFPTKEVSIETNLSQTYSFGDFLEMSSKELYDEFFDACFKLDYYSYESYKKYFDNNISHFNNLLKNELKLRK